MRPKFTQIGLDAATDAAQQMREEGTAHVRVELGEGVSVDKKTRQMMGFVTTEIRQQLDNSDVQVRVTEQDDSGFTFEAF